MMFRALHALYRVQAKRLGSATRSSVVPALLLSLHVQAAPEVQELFKSEVDGMGQALSYSGGAPAQLTGAIVTLAPGDSTGWHTHSIPVAGYLMSGTLTVQYQNGEERVFQAGEGVIEVMDLPHQGINAGSEPVRLVVFYAGAPGVPLSSAAAAP